MSTEEGHGGAARGDAGSSEGGRVSVILANGRLDVERLAGDGEGLPTGKRGRVHVKNMPMTGEATMAQLSGNRSLNMQAAFAQAAHCTVVYEMCPKWRRRRKAALLDEALHRWFVARVIRDSVHGWRRAA